MPPRFATALLVGALFVTGTGACARLPRQNPTSLSIWLAPLPGKPGGGAFLSANDATGYVVGETISIDTISFRPAGVRPNHPPILAGGMSSLAAFAIVTTYQGSRYHPETIRALAEDTVALASAAGAIARESQSRMAHTLVMDFQGMASSDVTGLVTFVRSLNDSARTHLPGRSALIVPPADTVAYPTSALAAVAPTIVVRLYGEHQPGTGPGALASAEWISRQLGLRAVDIGVNRLMAELPLFGYLWQRDGSARSISYSDAARLVSAEASSFRRDQPTGFLTATGREGWTIWIPDAESVERMIRIVRRAGVSRVMLTGMEGADPDLWVRLPALRR